MDSRDIRALIEVMARLRDPTGGCPWDREQDFRSIAPYTIEEAYEVADAIERAAMDELREELGDLLFQVVFHSRMAEEAGHFGFDDVVAAIVDKMVRRHPHVFGDAEVADAEEQTRAWEAGKAAERAAKGDSGEPGILAGVTLGLPALSRAEKLQKRAARVGFDWPDAMGALDKVDEELDEVRTELVTADHASLGDEIGDLLFAAVNLARHCGIDPEAALRGANHKFERRFGEIERRLAGLGRTPHESDLEEMDSLWQAVKEDEALDADGG